MLPVLADRIDVAQIHEHAVCDGLRPRVGIDRFAERVFVGQESCRSAGGACITERDLIADGRWAISPAPEVKALRER